MTFWSAVARVAWSDTVAILRLTSKVGIMGWVLSALFVIGGLVYWGATGAAADAVLTYVLIAAAALAMIPLVFAWRFIATPPKAHQDLKGWVAFLEAAIVATQRTDRAVLGIAERYTEGLRRFENGEDMTGWEAEFDLYIQNTFAPGFYLQLCGPEPPTRGYTTIQRDGGPVRRINHPARSERDRLADKLGKISSMMPYAEAHHRGAEMYVLTTTAAIIERPDPLAPSRTADRP